MADGPGRATKLVDHFLYGMGALARMPSGWTGRWLCSSLRPQSASPGGVAERLNAPVLKTGSPSRGSWVQIPPPPPELKVAREGFEAHEQMNNRVRQLCGAKLDTGASATVAPSSRGASVGPPTRAIPPPPPHPSDSYLRFPAARVTDARGFSHLGARR
jgi:hypothetical protein